MGHEIQECNAWGQTKIAHATSPKQFNYLYNNTTLSNNDSNIYEFELMVVHLINKSSKILQNYINIIT